MLQDRIQILKNKAYSLWQKEKYPIVFGSIFMVILYIISDTTENNLENELQQNSVFTRVFVTKTRYRKSFVNFDYYYVTEKDTIFYDESVDARDVKQPILSLGRELKDNISKMKLLIQYNPDNPMRAIIRYDLVCEKDCFNWGDKLQWEEIPPNWKKIDLPRPYDTL